MNKPQFKQQLGTRLAQARVAAGFPTQADAARGIPIDASTISEYESGKKLASAYYLWLLATHYRCSMDWLTAPESLGRPFVVDGHRTERLLASTSTKDPAWSDKADRVFPLDIRSRVAGEADVNNLRTRIEQHWEQLGERRST